jgi:RNA polymerase sigma-70 factor (ECF subfamily)
VTTAPDFAEFYAATFHPLCVQLYAHTGDLAEAQDVVQEAFCRAMPRWSRLAEYDDPTAWVRKVAWNLATSRWRRVRRMVDLGKDHHADPMPPPDPARVDLMTALATLPVRQRQAVVLHYLADTSIAEIAEITGAAEGTVKSWLHRARAALAAQLGPEFAEGGVVDV